MTRSYWLLFLSLWCVSAPAQAQFGESDLRIFGYFQTLFQYQRQDLRDINASSFSLQQLNLFLQKDLAKNWRAFVNVEAVNTFNSKRNWGSLRFEEAWARYRSGVKFNLKVGLQIPTFNHFNEIKNRTPLLPYAIRPLVYESSFEEFVSVDEYLPTRAFIQVYGFLPYEDLKVDYALYVGNSPNINDSSNWGQTGVDTTASLMVGGRVGIRFAGLKAGVSMTRQNTDFFDFATELYGGTTREYQDIIQRRLGFDVSFALNKLYFESEYISVSYEESKAIANVDKDFYYGTLGYELTEAASIYGTYWHTGEDLEIVDFIISIWSAGFAYEVNDRTTLKAQYARVKASEEVKQAFGFALPSVTQAHSNYFAAALSVFF